MTRKEKRKLWDEQMSQAHVIGELWEAARQGRLEQLKSHIASSGNVDAQNRFGNTALLYAASGGHFRTVEWLLDVGADIHHRTPRCYHTGGRFSALHQAAVGGHLEVVRLLLSRGAKIDTKDGFGRSALILATEERHITVAEELLASGANVNLKGQGGWTPIRAAIDTKQLETAKLLARYGANIHEGAGALCGTLLADAIANEDTASLIWLLDAGVNPNLPDSDGQTPLMAAAAKGNAEATLKLLQTEASVQARDKTGWTPLFHAVVGRNPQVVAALLEHGADPLAVAPNPLLSSFPNGPPTWTARDVARRFPQKEVILRLEAAMPERALDSTSSSNPEKPS